MNVTSFKKIITDYYKLHRRDLPWRNTTDPYAIVVSEIMLQQTQVARVLQKYSLFLKQFPTFKKLVQTSLNDVLAVWSGMGYNRRAIYLKKMAEIVTTTYNGKLPDNPIILITLPGIGKNTAGSISAFAFNKPVTFIETNIRRVFIHFFFKDEINVDDKQLMPFIEKTLDVDNPRDWYYALMDYGAYLAKSTVNPNRKSKHYTVQSMFKGSNREVRGGIIKELVKCKTLTVKQIYSLPFEKERIDVSLSGLLKEGFVMEKRGIYSIK